MSEKNLTASRAKDALQELLSLLNEDPKLEEIRETSSNDMLKYIQNFLPYSIEVQTRVISKYGFTEDNSGLIKFTNRVKEICIEDKEVADLFEDFKALLIPPLTVQSQCV